MSERITVDCPECGFKVLVLEDQRRGYCLQHRGMFWVSDAIIKDLQSAKQQAEQSVEKWIGECNQGLELILKLNRDVEIAEQAKEAAEQKARALEGALSILAEIRAEQEHGRQKYGRGPNDFEHDDGHSRGDWTRLIREHESQAILEVGTPMEWRQRMVKIAGLALSAIESFDRQAQLQAATADKEGAKG